MLAILGIILIVFWILGAILHIAGGLIHLVLAVALLMLILHFVQGKKPM